VQTHSSTLSWQQPVDARRSWPRSTSVVLANRNKIFSDLFIFGSAAHAASTYRSHPQQQVRTTGGVSALPSLAAEEDDDKPVICIAFHLCCQHTSLLRLLQAQQVLNKLVGAPSRHVSAAFCCIVFAICVSVNPFHKYCSSRRCCLDSMPSMPSPSIISDACEASTKMPQA
jgi:hypothetical protein